MDSKNEFARYSEKRNIKKEYYESYSLPSYLGDILPKSKNISILDIGCGYGQTLRALRDLSYTKLEGIDLDENAIEYCKKNELEVSKSSLEDYLLKNKKKYDILIMSHVLEHIDKSKIVDILGKIRRNLLNKDGELWIMVPNAQANTGAYWAYEDFTHTTLFTAGSLYYVLKSAGFEHIDILDPEGLSGLAPHKKLIKKFLLSLYRLNYKFWNRVTTSAFHIAGPHVFSFEIKARAK